MLSYLEGVTNAEIAGLVDRSPARVRHRTRPRTRRHRRRPVLGAGRIGYHQLASANSRRSIPSLPTARQDTGAPATPDRAGRSRCRNARGRAADGQRCASALCRTAAIRSLDVLPHGPSPPGLVGPEPHRRTQIGKQPLCAPSSPESGRCSVAVGASGATWVRRLPRHPTKVRVGTRWRFYADRVWPNGGGAMLWWEYATRPG